jgi:hypothetical protein
VVTSDYLDVTDPEALRSLMLLQDDGAQVRVYESAGSSFVRHPRRGRATARPRADRALPLYRNDTTTLQILRTAPEFISSIGAAFSCAFTIAELHTGQLTVIILIVSALLDILKRSRRSNNSNHCYLIIFLVISIFSFR